jgi:Leucine-rich repeat (LRR) protein
VRFLITILLSLFTLSGFAQLETPFWLERLEQRDIYFSLEEAMENPDEVYRLHLKRKKLNDLPDDIFRLRNLQELDISKNKFKELPWEIAKLKNLKRLIAIKNKMETVHPAIGKMKNLKHLILNQNDLKTLPPEIADCEELEYIDLWSNEISSFPKTMKKMVSLKEVDLRVIQFTPTEMERIKEALPNVQIHVSNDCNCAN